MSAGENSACGLRIAP